MDQNNGKWFAFVALALAFGLFVGAQYKDELVALFGEAPAEGQEIIQKGVYFPNTEPLGPDETRVIGSERRHEAQHCALVGASTRASRCFSELAAPDPLGPLCERIKNFPFPRDLYVLM